MNGQWQAANGTSTRDSAKQSDKRDIEHFALVDPLSDSNISVGDVLRVHAH